MKTYVCRCFAFVVFYCVTLDLLFFVKRKIFRMLKGNLHHGLKCLFKISDVDNDKGEDFPDFDLISWLNRITNDTKLNLVTNQLIHM